MKYKVYNTHTNKVIGSKRAKKGLKQGEIITYLVDNNINETIMYEVRNKLNDLLFVSPITYQQLQQKIKETVINE